MALTALNKRKELKLLNYINMGTDLPTAKSFEDWKSEVYAIRVEELLIKIKTAESAGYLEYTQDSEEFPGVIYNSRDLFSRFPEDLQQYMHVANIEMSRLFIKKLNLILTQTALDPNFYKNGVLDFNSLLLSVLRSLLEELDVRILMIFYLAAVSQGDSGFRLIDATLAFRFINLAATSRRVTNILFVSDPNESKEKHCPFPTFSRHIVNEIGDLAFQLSGSTELKFNIFSLSRPFKSLTEEIIKEKGVDLRIDIDKFFKY